MRKNKFYEFGYIYSTLKSNLHGWLQARKLLPREEITEYNPSQEEIDSWNLKEYE